MKYAIAFDDDWREVHPDHTRHPSWEESEDEPMLVYCFFDDGREMVVDTNYFPNSPRAGAEVLADHQARRVYDAAGGTDGIERVDWPVAKLVYLERRGESGEVAR